jgi:hypothetical protein
MNFTLNTSGLLEHTQNMTKSMHKPSSPFRPKVIKSDEDHKHAIARIEELFAVKLGT